MDKAVVGTSVPRQDLPDKLTGQAKFTSDIKLPGMLYGRILRSPYPHARILSVDSSKAEAMPGVHAVVTPFDVPEGRLAPDLAILDTKVRFVGDEVAAVAADDEDTALEALEALEVEYEPLTFVTDAEEALRPSSAPIHGESNLVGGKPLSLTRGDVEEGFRQADRIFEETYTTPAHSGAALEPRVAIAMWEGPKLTVWKASRGVHADRISISTALGIPRDDVRVIGPPMGAGYGTKDETRLAAITVLLAQRAGRPVKIELTREEEFVAGRKRHATKTTVKVGVKNDGTVTAVHATTIMDTGAYLSSGPGVVRRAGQGALYLYRCANVRYDGFLVYTNQPSGGSYRALGAPQGHFALETTMTKIAMALGMDPLGFRLKNHVGPEGQPGERITPVDEIVDTQPVEGGIPFSSNGLRQCLENGAEAFRWADDAPKSSPVSGAKKVGRGMCMFIYRGGPGSRAQARVRLNRDGTVQLIAGLMDVGEGNTTAISQIVAEEMGVRYEQISTTFGDSSTTPEAPITSGSTATFSTGLAAKQAAGELRDGIIRLAAEHLAVPEETLGISGDDIIDVQSSRRMLTLLEVVRLQEEGELSAEASLMPGSKDFIVNSFGAHFAEVEVDTDTGSVRVLRYVAAHDSGRILNPNLARNQVEGGVSQMLGFALTEQMITDGRTGATVNASFLEHKGPTIQEYPDIEVLFADIEDPVGPFGAKGLGEPPSIGVAPAVVHAIYDAVGVWIHDLPATPDKILNALSLKEGGL